MDITSVLLIAVALAIDAFAVALATGVCLPEVSVKHTLRLALSFGFFQAGMNILGWATGLTFRILIEAFDHWLAFGLLLLVGGHMIREALKNNDEDCPTSDPTRGISLLMLSIATSIDSLAVGLSFAILKVSVWYPALIIGIVAFLMTACGLHLGRLVRSASRLGHIAEIGGGVVLIGIGVRILVDHGVF